MPFKVTPWKALKVKLLAIPPLPYTRTNVPTIFSAKVQYPLSIDARMLVVLS